MRCPKCGKNISRTEEDLNGEYKIYFCEDCDYYFKGHRTRNFNDHPFSWKMTRNKNDIEIY